LKENHFIVYVNDVIANKPYGIFTLSEFLNIKHELILDGMESSILFAKIERVTEQSWQIVQDAALKRLRESVNRGKSFGYNTLLQDMIDQVLTQNNLYNFIKIMIEFEEKWLLKSGIKLLDIITLSKQFEKDAFLTAKFFSFLKKIQEVNVTENENIEILNRAKT